MKSDAFMKVLSTTEGREVLWEIMAECGTFRNAFSGDDAQTAFLLGKQFIGQKLLGMINEADHKMFGLMQDEAIDNAQLISGG